MIKYLISLANHLDKKGLTKEADYLDSIIQKEAKKKKNPRLPKTKMELAQQELSFKLSRLDEENKEEGVDPFIENDAIKHALGDISEYLSYLYSKSREGSEEIFYNDYVVEVIERHYPSTTQLDTEEQINMFTEYSEKLRNVYENNQEKMYGSMR